MSDSGTVPGWLWPFGAKGGQSLCRSWQWDWIGYAGDVAYQVEDRHPRCRACLKRFLGKGAAA